MRHLTRLKLLFHLMWLLAGTACFGEDAARETTIEVLTKRCGGCHDEQGSGGVNLLALTSDFNRSDDLKLWVKIERAIVEGRMPPKSEPGLSPPERKLFDKWFVEEFVRPGGLQRPGRTVARRLTREELQNTLEDLLHLDIRVPLTNSRLHVIPDTIIEKFFATGVIGESGFSNDADTLAREPIDLQTYARCFKLVLAMLDRSGPARVRLFGHESLPDRLSLDAATSLIQDFSSRAFRRQVTPTELRRFVSLYEHAMDDRDSYSAIKSVCLAVLLSPPFLFRFEAPADHEQPQLLTDAELAVRLSYFLWSSPPDDQLWEAARKGLHEPSALRSQVQRMLADPRRIALAENLGGEWFGYKKLRQQSAVNKRSDRMAGFYRTQYEEGLLFFDSLIRYNQPIFRIVDADWTFSNRHQTGIYGLGTGNKQFPPAVLDSALPPINIHYRSDRRSIKDGNYEYRHEPLKLTGLSQGRGGLITLGPTMSITSTPNRTSPIRRGVWVMERILGQHFEVPADVPDLEATQKKAEREKRNLTHNELLKLHSSQPGCASCHQYIDPIGFGLESLDQLGIPRTISTAPVSGEQHHWSPKDTPRVYTDRSWKLKRAPQAGAETKVFFQYSNGHHRLNIRKVRLRSGDTVLSDPHFGFTGSAAQENVWFFQVPNGAPTDGWELVAEVQGAGGNDSHGTITIVGPDDAAEPFQLPNGSEFSTPDELKVLLLRDYRGRIADNAIHRVLAYALGRATRPTDRPAILQIQTRLEKDAFKMNSLIEAVVLSYPFRHKE